MISFDINSNGIININLKISDDGITSLKDSAVIIYSSILDALLNLPGWNILNINFEGVGKVSMNYNESKSNEYGMRYFDSLDIKKIKVDKKKEA